MEVRDSSAGPVVIARSTVARWAATRRASDIGGVDDGEHEAAIDQSAQGIERVGTSHAAAGEAANQRGKGRAPRSKFAEVHPVVGLEIQGGGPSASSSVESATTGSGSCPDDVRAVGQLRSPTRRRQNEPLAATKAWRRSEEPETQVATMGRPASASPDRDELGWGVAIATAT